MMGMFILNRGVVWSVSARRPIRHRWPEADGGQNVVKARI